MVMAAPGAEQRVRFFGRSYLKPRVRDRFRPARDGVQVFALLKHATGRTGMHRPFCADLHGWRDADDPFLISRKVLAAYKKMVQSILSIPIGPAAITATAPRRACNGLAARPIERNHVASCTPSSPRQWGGIERRLEIVQPERFFEKHHMA